MRAGIAGRIALFVFFLLSSLCTFAALPNVSTALSGGTSESFASEFWFAEYSSESSDTSGKAAVERCAFGH